MKKISKLYAVGESPKDEAPEKEHDSYQRQRMLKITKIENELKKWDQDFQRFDSEEVVSETVLENDFYENIYNFYFLMFF